MNRDARSLQIEITIAPAKRGGRGRKIESTPAIPASIPRITRLLALAIKFQDLVDRGEVRDYADLARLGYVTRARLTQVMNLLLLAPDIQEQILMADGAATAFGERRVRCVTAEVSWEEQRRLWGTIEL